MTGQPRSSLPRSPASRSTSVGIEMHPANGVIYACTNDTISTPSTLDGGSDQIGPGMGHTQTCNNLAAPWIKIACLDSF